MNACRASLRRAHGPITEVHNEYFAHGHIILATNVYQSSRMFEDSTAFDILAYKWQITKHLDLDGTRIIQALYV